MWLQELLGQCLQWDVTRDHTHTYILVAAGSRLLFTYIYIYINKHRTDMSTIRLRT